MKRLMFIMISLVTCASAMAMSEHDLVKLKADIESSAVWYGKERGNPVDSAGYWVVAYKACAFASIKKGASVQDFLHPELRLKTKFNVNNDEVWPYFKRAASDYTEAWKIVEREAEQDWQEICKAVRAGTLDLSPNR